MKILLIEDEDYIRDLYIRQLNLGGFLTDGFAKAEEGLQALQKNSYDLVLLDIMLPDKSGLEVLKEIKENNNTKNIPVVMLTNLGQEIIIEKAFKLGAEGYLIKASLTPDQMVQEVRNILDKKIN